MNEGIKFSKVFSADSETWQPGVAPVAVVMISLNEAHNIHAVMQNLKGWAQEVFLVDSFSRDETVNIALSYGVHVVQRKFLEFGDQWNFALHELPISAQWVMKLDPDERLPDELKINILNKIKDGDCDAMLMNRRLFFMGKPLAVSQKLIRIWKNGNCIFTDVAVNEHPIVDGVVAQIRGEIEHYDSPDLEHWLEKQNNYTTAEAIISHNNRGYADKPLFFGSSLQHRMWLKKNFDNLPFRYVLLFIYIYFFQGAWRSGSVGLTWARLRIFVMKMREYKRHEIEITGKIPTKRFYGAGEPDLRVNQFSSERKYIVRKVPLISKGAKFHETLALGWSDSYLNKGFSRRLYFWSKILNKLIVPNSSWADLGCGSGTLTEIILDRGATVVGVDQSPAMIQEAYKNLYAKYGSLVRLVESDVTKIDELQNESFDGVISSSVFEYLSLPKQALNEINRLLRPNGLLVVSIPPTLSIVRLVQKFVRFILGLVGVNIFEYLTVSNFEIKPNEIHEFFKDSGFVVRKVEKFDSKLPGWIFYFLRPSLLVILANKK